MRNNWKLKQWEHYKSCTRNIQSHGIRVNGCFILGLDEQDSSAFDQVVAYARELGLFDVQVTILTAFPGTPLYAALFKQNRIIKNNAWQLCTLFDINIYFRHISTSEFDSKFKQMVHELYGEEFTNWRKENFRKKYLKQLV
jgi:radical SAM superfamily enzyme YgiQ (UPF0313 family)